MKISALTDIVGGKLLNAPAISFVTQVHVDINKINEGDAFITNKQEHIDIALANGVFAIILNFKPKITNSEIAWIQVDNLNKAKTDILRYKLLEKDIQFFYIDIIYKKMLKLFITKELSSDILILSENSKQDFEALSYCTKKIVFGTNKKFLESITPIIKKLRKKSYSIKNFINHSLFEISFSYGGIFYDTIKLPKLYLDHFIQVMKFYDLSIDLNKLKNFELFKPLYINRGLQIVPFGQTNRFILANSNQYIYNYEIKFLKKLYSYAIIKIIDISKYSDEKIYDEIKKLDFNALYCKGKDIKEINQILEQNNNVDKLF
jgi:ferrochelatase